MATVYRLTPMSELKRRINRRAHELAKEAFERYRAELEAAIAENTVDPSAIDEWLPADRK